MSVWRSRVRRAAAVLVVFVVWLAATSDPRLVRAQTPASNILVIDGGTLIDGSGGAPIRDAQIVIDGDRIRDVGRKGRAAPAGAQIVNADGKFIVPGLWDGLANFLWYQGEIFLNNGVTSGPTPAAEPRHRHPRHCPQASATRGSRSPRLRRSTRVAVTMPTRTSRRSSSKRVGQR